MEVSFEKISYKDKLSNISFKLDNNYVNGIYNANSLLKIIKEPSLISSGHIFIDDRIYRKYNSKLIAIIDNDKSFYTSKVLEEILFNAKIREYKSHSIKQEIEELLLMVGLDESILKRIVPTLSTTEKYFVQVVANLIYKPKIVIFKDIMNGLDLNNKKIIKKLINKLKSDGVLVIVTSNDSNILYELTERVAIINQNEVILGNTNDIYQQVEMLINKKIDTPYFSLLTYKAKKEKNINLFYRKDVRDVMKDVYKSI